LDHRQCLRRDLGEVFDHLLAPVPDDHNDLLGFEDLGGGQHMTEHAATGEFVEDFGGPGFHPGALTCGANPGSPVTPEYEGPFAFTGTLNTVTLDVSGELIDDPEAELRMHLARQ
jgi:hypothetical protein